jgi:hypothetical protein
MSTQIEKRKLPSLEDLIQDTEMSIKDNQLTILLNQQPPASWLKGHPTAKTKNEQGENVQAKYLPIDKVEFMLTKIYPKWWVEVLDTKIMANSVCVTVRVFVLNPITNEIEHQDGVGAKSIQTDSGAGAMDWNKAKDAGVMMALPSAKTYAIKDAVEHFGRIFGRDLNRQNQVSYDSLLKSTIDVSDLKELFELKKDSLDAEMIKNVERIINNKEVDKYKAIFETLKNI